MLIRSPKLLLGLACPVPKPMQRRFFEGGLRHQDDQAYDLPEQVADLYAQLLQASAGLDLG